MREYKYPSVHCSVICNRQDLEGAQASFGKWLGKITMVHLPNEILFGCNEEENIILCNSMEGPREHYAKWNKVVRERQIPYDFTHMRNIMNKLN